MSASRDHDMWQQALDEFEQALLELSQQAAMNGDGTFAFTFQPVSTPLPAEFAERARSLVALSNEVQAQVREAMVGIDRLQSAASAEGSAQQAETPRFVDIHA